MSLVADRIADRRLPRELVEPAGVSDQARLVAAAERLRGDPDRTTDFLAELAGDDAAATEVADRSYWHPNGFAKLVLVAAADRDVRVRLHVWPASDTTPAGESNPHSHRWNFASYVLAGRGMHLAEFAEVTGRGARYRRYRYGTDPANPAALLSDGEVRLEQIATSRVGRGEVYYCGTQVVHIARPVDGGLTATLVVQGPQRTPATAVYCEPGLSDDQPNRRLSVRDLRMLTTAVLTALHPGAP